MFSIKSHGRYTASQAGDSKMRSLRFHRMPGDWTPAPQQRYYYYDVVSVLLVGPEFPSPRYINLIPAIAGALPLSPAISHHLDSFTVKSLEDVLRVSTLLFPVQLYINSPWVSC